MAQALAERGVSAAALVQHVGPGAGAAQRQQPSGSATAGVADAAAEALHCLSEEFGETTVHFQVLDLGRQLYVWAGTAEARMGALCLASPPAGAPGTAAGVPPVATLLRGGGGGGAGGDSAAASVAARLAMVTGRSVAAAWVLPEEPPTLALAAEKRLAAELRALAATRGAAALSLGA